MDTVAFATALGFPTNRPHTLRACLSGPTRFNPAPSSRSHLRMMCDVEASGDDAEDEAPSDTYVPTVEAPVGEDSRRSALVAKLLQLAAITSRGQLASESQASAIEDVVMSLEEVNPNPQPVETDLIDGTWTLAYTTSKFFQSNSIIKALAQPLFQFGQVRQKISVDDGTLVSEVDVVAFPLTSGTIKLNSKVTPVGSERLEVVVDKINVTGGKIAERLDLGGISFDVPIQEILQRIRNTTPETYLDTYYLDETLRISRSKQGKLFVYTRLD